MPSIANTNFTLPMKKMIITNKTLSEWMYNLKSKYVEHLTINNKTKYSGPENFYMSFTKKEIV